MVGLRMFLANQKQKLLKGSLHFQRQEKDEKLQLGPHICYMEIFNIT